MSTNNTLKILLEGDNSSFISSLNQANSHLSSVVKEMSSSFGGLGSAISGLAGPLAAFTSITGTIAGIGEMITHTAELGETLELASKKTGLTVEELGKLRYAAKMVNVDFDSVITGLARLSKNMMESLVTPSSLASRAFKALGIDVKDSTGHLKSTDEILTEVADKFSNFKDGPEKMALAMALFGRSGANLIPILDEGSKGLAKLGIQAEKAGDVMSGPAAKAAAEFDDKVKNLKARGEGLGITVGESLLPAMSALADAFSSDSGSGIILTTIITTLKIAINSVVSLILFMTQGIKTLFDIGTFVFKTLKGLILSLGHALSDVLHGHLLKAKDEFKNFGDETVKNWNTMLDKLYDSSNKTEQSFFTLWGQGSKENTNKSETTETGATPKFDAKNPNTKNEAAKKHAETLKSLNEGLEKEHILLTKGEKAAYEYELAQKGLTKAEIAKLTALHESNLALKKNQEEAKKTAEETKKQDAEYNKEHEALLKQQKDQDYQLLEQGIKYKYNAYEISGQQEIIQLKNLNTQRYEEEKKALEEKLKLYQKDKVEREKILIELDKLSFKYSQDQKKYKDQLDSELAKQNGWAGAKKAVLDFVDNAKNNFQKFSSMANNIMGSAESGIANALKGMIQGTMTFGDAIKSIWSSITDSIISSISKMIAQWIVAQAAQAIFGTTTQTVESAKAAASLDTANAETWAAYAAIPFVGPALALAQIATMTAEFTAAKASNKALTAFATGGMVDTPTLGIFGEKGKEYLVPEKDMNTLLPSLVNQGVQIYKALANSNSYANKSLGSNFAPSKQQITNNNNNQSGHTFIINGVIGNKADLGKYLKDTINSHTMRYGSAL